MAALGVVLAIMRACPRAIDASIERILPSVFSRQQDPKEQVRSTAADVLQGVSMRHNDMAGLACLVCFS
jgi:hypothetical protein